MGYAEHLTIASYYMRLAGISDEECVVYVYASPQQLYHGSVDVGLTLCLHRVATRGGSGWRQYQ